MRLGREVPLVIQVFCQIEAAIASAGALAPVNQGLRSNLAGNPLIIFLDETAEAKH